METNLATHNAKQTEEIEAWPSSLDLTIVPDVPQGHERASGDIGPVLAPPQQSFHNDLDIWQLFTEDLLPGFESIQASPRFLDTVGLSDLFPAIIAGPSASNPPVPGPQTSQFWVTDEPINPVSLTNVDLPSSPTASHTTNLPQGHSQHAVEQATSIVTDTVSGDAGSHRAQR